MLAAESAAGAGAVMRSNSWIGGGGTRVERWDASKTAERRRRFTQAFGFLFLCKKSPASATKHLILNSTVDPLTGFTGSKL